MRFVASMNIMVLTCSLVSCCKKPEDSGLAYRGVFKAENVRLLVDETWVDAKGQRHVDQEIFDEVFHIIDEAQHYILLDFFLVNDFYYVPGPCMRPLTAELVERLVAKRRTDPDVEIVFITDPINTVYGSIASPYFQKLEMAGVQVVWTNLDALRDSNPLFSKPWRLFGKPWGTGPGRAFANPMGKGRISLRSTLKLLNFKANHRKLVVTENSLLVTSANPHSASSAHWNTALRVDGAGMDLACEVESAILRMSGSGAFRPLGVSKQVADTAARMELLTEQKIKDKALELLARAEPGARIDLCMFYFSERDLIEAFVEAEERGCNVRIILDPNKDAFGRTKDGIPNRQTAAKLVKAGTPLRWADTHGEQCHVKMLYVDNSDGTATLMLGSSNFTRRNLNNFNTECDLALTATVGDDNMLRAREVFERWWLNSAGRLYTVPYENYEDRSLRRRLRAWFSERTGMCTF